MFITILCHLIILSNKKSSLSNLLRELNHTRERVTRIPLCLDTNYFLSSTDYPYTFNEKSDLFNARLQL